MAEERIPKGFRSKRPWEPSRPGDLPDFPHVIFKDAVWAKCPLCGTVRTLRVCYGCKAIMCEECLPEHQIVCLHRGEEARKRR